MDLECILVSYLTAPGTRNQWMKLPRLQPEFKGNRWSSDVALRCGGWNVAVRNHFRLFALKFSLVRFPCKLTTKGVHIISTIFSNLSASRGFSVHICRVHGGL